MSLSAAATLRPPDQVMRLDRLGASHQTRLSFLRVLLRRMQAEEWAFDRPVFAIGDDGFGHAVYRAKGPAGIYSLVAFSTDLAPEQRTDRVIAEAWDTSYALFDGEPTAADIARLADNVPRQEAGRYLASELVLSRANRSVRLFERVVAALAAGSQPDAAQVASVGYLMRTTAVYGNGKFGIADRDRVAGRPPLDGPFRAEMLTVWLIRAFTVDLAEHLARIRSPATAVPFEPRIRRLFGVGNSTGLGMAPFLVKHPALLSRWVEARETALARVRALPVAGVEETVSFHATLRRARASVAQWVTDDPVQTPRILGLATDLARLQQQVDAGALEQPHPWDRLIRFAEDQLSLEGQEYTVALVIEPHGALVDTLADEQAIDEDEAFGIDGRMTVAALGDLIERNYAFALQPDYAARCEQARFWYTSVEKLEPRLGERFDEPGGELEQPLGIGRDVKALQSTLAGAEPSQRIAAFLMQHPEHRHVARRVQASAGRPYAEIRDNLLSSHMRPIDLLRSKLAFFGATRFDPRSDRWLRITLFQGAPFPHELATSDADAWVYDALAPTATGSQASTP